MSRLSGMARIGDSGLFECGDVCRQNEVLMRSLGEGSSTLIR